MEATWRHDILLAFSNLQTHGPFLKWTTTPCCIRKPAYANCSIPIHLNPALVPVPSTRQGTLWDYTLLDSPTAYPPARLILSCTSSGDSCPHSSLRDVNDGVLTIALLPPSAPTGVPTPTPPAAAAAAAATAPARVKLVCGVLKAPCRAGVCMLSAAGVVAATGVEAARAAAEVLLAWLRGAPRGVSGVVMAADMAG
jgi:hypothetical protein